MPIDANIPLQVHQLKIPTAGEVMSLKDLAVRNQINEQNLQEKQMEVQKRNSLLQITQSPGFSDPNSGTPTPQGIAAYTRIDPEGGIKLSQMAQQMNIQNMAIDEKRTAVKRNILTGYVESYQRNLQLTGDKAQAEKTAREEAMSSIQEGKKSGHFAAQGFSANELEHDLPPPDVARTAVLAMGGKVAEPPKLEHTTAINPETKKLGLFDSRTGTFRKDAQGRFIEPPPTSTFLNMTNAPDKETLNFMAKQYLTGDKSVMVGLARSPITMNAMRKEIVSEAKAQGMTPAHVSVKMAEFQGALAAERVAGTREAQLGFAAHELEQFVPLAENASKAVPRVGFKPINQLIQLGENQMSPDQRAFVAANRAVVQAYGQVAARGGTNVHSVVEAEKMLSTADSHAAYKAVLNQLQLETKGALQAPKEVKKDIAEGITGERKTEAAKPDIKSLLDKYK